MHQGAVIAAVQLGVTDTWALTLLLGLGQLVVPAVIWCAALWFSRTDAAVLAAVATTAVLCASTTWFVNVSESVLVVPLTVLVSVLLWQPRAWSRAQALTAAGASLILVASYETVLVTGAVLAAWAIARARRSSSARDRYTSAFVAGASVASVGVALWGMTRPGDPQHAQSLLYFVVSFEPRALFVGAIGVMLLMAVSDRRIADRSGAALALGASAAALLLAAMMIESTQRESFAARGGIAAVAIVLQFYLCWRWTNPVQASQGRLAGRVLVLTPLVLVVACSFSVVRGLDEWSRSLHAFQAAVGSNQGIHSVEAAVPVERRAIVWGWTSSSLSLVLRCDAQGAVLVDSSPSYFAFPPAAARSQVADAFVWRSGRRCSPAAAQRGKFSRPPLMHAATSSARLAIASQSALRSAGVIVNRPRTVPTP